VGLGALLGDQTGGPSRIVELKELVCSSSLLDHLAENGIQYLSGVIVKFIHPLDGFVKRAFSFALILVSCWGWHGQVVKGT